MSVGRCLPHGRDLCGDLCGDLCEDACRDGQGRMSGRQKPCQASNEMPDSRQGQAANDKGEDGSGQASVWGYSKPSSAARMTAAWRLLTWSLL